MAPMPRKAWNPATLLTFGRGAQLALTVPMLTECIRVLEAHGWVRLPLMDNRLIVFTHGKYLLDRIHIHASRWAHQHVDAGSWRSKSRMHGNDAASLDTYLTTHFPRDGR